MDSYFHVGQHFHKQFSGAGDPLKQVIHAAMTMTILYQLWSSRCIAFYIVSCILIENSAAVDNRKK